MRGGSALLFPPNLADSFLNDGHVSVEPAAKKKALTEEKTGDILPIH